MIDRALLQQVVSLSADDRRELFEAAQEELDPELSALIDDRERAARTDPGSGRSWTEFRDELRERHGA